jgi:hypothetical protein
MRKPETTKMMTRANLATAIFAAVEAASNAGLSKTDVEAVINYVLGTLED